jgi:hypothetical protein
MGYFEIRLGLSDRAKLVGVQPILRHGILLSFLSGKRKILVII